MSLRYWFRAGIAALVLTALLAACGAPAAAPTVVAPEETAAEAPATEAPATEAPATEAPAATEAAAEPTAEPADEATPTAVAEEAAEAATPVAASEDVPVSLEFNSWVLASIGEIDALGGVPVTVEFVDEGQLQGWTGCNDYSATFSSSAEDGTVQIQDVTVASDNPCRSDAATTQEELFLANLAATASFELSGFDLRLFNADGSLGLTLHSTLPLELEGLQWYASFYADEAGQLTPILPDGPQLTAAFAEEEVSGFSGCYNFVARATVQGDAVTIEPFATGAAGTANAECTEASPLVIQEALYRKALEMAATWELAGPNLRLYDAQGNATAIFLAGPVADAVSQ